MNYHDPSTGCGLAEEKMEQTKERVCAALARLLSEGIDVHRCLAAQALGRIGHPAAVDPLLQALADEDEDVRTDAVAALSGLADPRAARPLLESFLGDPCGDVKRGAIEALVELRCAEAVPWLRRLLKGRDEDMAWDEGEFYESGWDDWVDIQVAAVSALAELGAEEAVPEIAAAIDDELGQDLTEVGFKAMARLGEPGVEALARYLDRGDQAQRRRAAACLAGIGGEGAGAALGRALADGSADVRLAAARALAAIDLADERLAALFDDGEAEVRAEAVRLCGRAHPDRLVALFGDKAHKVRRAVLEVLAEEPGLLAADQVVPWALERLRASAPKTAAAAARALAAVAPEQAFDDLVRQATDTERMVEVRLAALEALAATGGPSAIPVLAGLVGDALRRVRLEAMAALARRAGADPTWPNPAAEALLAALEGDLVAPPEPVATEAGPKEPTAGETAAGAEAEKGPEEGDGGAQPAPPTSTLQAILGDDSPELQVVKGADERVELTPTDLEFLGLAQRKLRKKQVPIEPKVAPYQDVRRFAARVLGDIARPEVAGALAAALKDADEEVRSSAADSLARIGERLPEFTGEVVEALTEAVASRERNLRLPAVRALGAAGGPRALHLLSGCLGDDDSFIRAEAIRALARLGHAGPEVAGLLQDPDPGVRLAAAHAVAAAPDGLDRLVDFAFAFQGYHGTEAARLLRDLDAAAASARFMAVLDQAERRREWAVAIEALAELNRPATAAAA